MSREFIKKKKKSRLEKINAIIMLNLARKLFSETSSSNNISSYLKFNYDYSHSESKNINYVKYRVCKYYIHYAS